MTFHMIPAPIVLLLLLAGIVHAQQEAEVTLSAVTNEVLAGDPLFLKILVTNVGDDPLPVYRSMGAPLGGARFEVRSPGADEFKRVRITNEGLQQGPPTPPFALIPPGDNYAGYSVLFLHGAEPIFAEAGRYELRVGVILGSSAKPDVDDLHLVTSDPITVTVKERPHAKMKLIRESANDLRYVVLGPEGVTNSVEPAKLRAIETQLSESELKKALGWTSLIIEAFKTENANERSRLLKQVAEIRSKSDPITSEVIGLVLGEKYISRREWKEAKAVLEMLKTRSYHSDNIKAVVEHALAGLKGT